mmetsp:Transcript_87542/g.152404  ORF Transcript_87542/g.152404 Transcript_87542/m.152404 type:complete len:313 (-) Transcript_87542:353-1291(-)
MCVRGERGISVRFGVTVAVRFATRVACPYPPRGIAVLPNRLSNRLSACAGIIDSLGVMKLTIFSWVSNRNFRPFVAFVSTIFFVLCAFFCNTCFSSICCCKLLDDCPEPIPCDMTSLSRIPYRSLSSYKSSSSVGALPPCPKAQANRRLTCVRCTSFSMSRSAYWIWSKGVWSRALNLLFAPLSYTLAFCPHKLIMESMNGLVAAWYRPSTSHCNPLCPSALGRFFGRFASQLKKLGLSFVDASCKSNKDSSSSLVMLLASARSGSTPASLALRLLYCENSAMSSPRGIRLQIVNGFCNRILMFINSECICT